MASETIHEFELQGCRFYIVWKPGMALLRVIESYGTPDQVHYTVANLCAEQYYGSDLTREEAVEKGELTAEIMLIGNRVKEAPLMEKLYNSPEEQAQYPVYLCRELVCEGKSYPLVWGSHNCNIYIRLAGEWLFVSWATSLEEALEKGRLFVTEKTAPAATPEGESVSTVSPAKRASDYCAACMHAALSFLRRWYFVLFIPAYITIILTFGWFDYWEAAHFFQWFLLICLGLWDLYLRFTCKSVPTGRGSEFTPGLLDRLTFSDCGLSLMLVVPVWPVALGVGVCFYRIL